LLVVIYVGLGLVGYGSGASWSLISFVSGTGMKLGIRGYSRRRPMIDPEDLRTIINLGGQACAILLGDLEREWQREGYDDGPSASQPEPSLRANSPAFMRWVAETREG
jgi:hypothetical protein